MALNTGLIFGINRKYYAKSAASKLNPDWGLWLLEVLGQLLSILIVACTGYYVWTSEDFKYWYYRYVVVVSVLTVVARSIASHYKW